MNTKIKLLVTCALMSVTLIAQAKTIATPIAKKTSDASALMSLMTCEALIDTPSAGAWNKKIIGTVNTTHGLAMFSDSVPYPNNPNPVYQPKTPMTVFGLPVHVIGFDTYILGGGDADDTPLKRYYMDVFFKLPKATVIKALKAHYSKPLTFKPLSDDVPYNFYGGDGAIVTGVKVAGKASQHQITVSNETYVDPDPSVINVEPVTRLTCVF